MLVGSLDERTEKNWLLRTERDDFMVTYTAISGEIAVESPPIDLSRLILDVIYIDTLVEMIIRENDAAQDEQNAIEQKLEHCDCGGVQVYRYEGGCEDPRP